MARLNLRTSGLPLTAIELRLGTNRLGRGAENDFVIPHPSVSSAHCEIVFLDGSIRVRDLNSTNGTFIEDQRITEASFQPGQVLRLGSVEFEMSDELFRVAIPEFGKKPGADGPGLSEGLAPCANHPGTVASVRCVQCERVFCEVCLKQLRRTGGQSLRLCPECSGRVEPLVNIGTKARKSSKKKESLRDRVKEALRVLKHGSR